MGWELTDLKRFIRRSCVLDTLATLSAALSPAVNTKSERRSLAVPSWTSLRNKSISCWHRPAFGTAKSGVNRNLRCATPVRLGDPAKAAAFCKAGLPSAAATCEPGFNLLNQDDQLRSIQHVCKCKECYHPPHPKMTSCVASNMCASARNVIIPPQDDQLRSIQHVCKCKECCHPPPTHPISCVAWHMCAKTR